MFLPRSIAAATCLVALAGCSDGLTAPKSAVFDTFGGPSMELTGTRFYVRVQLPCNPLRIGNAYIAPDAEGNFSLPETRLPGFHGGGATVAISGRLSGDRIDATVRWTSPERTVTNNHVLTRGARADFSAIACLAGA